jgi:putative addiction module killer protein
MFRTVELQEFSDWLEGLRDRKSAARIVTRLVRLQAGNFGDSKSIGDGLFELRCTFGPGYRVYFSNQDGTVIILLAGGDKGSQSRDIVNARKLLKQWREQEDGET